MAVALPPRVLRVTNVIGYALLVLVNVLSNQGVFGPNNTEVSKQYKTPITPAGWAFSIWGVIYALQGAAVIYAALLQGYTADGWKLAAVNAVGYGWQLTWLFECAWLMSFPQQTYLSFLLCAAFLCAALACIGGSLGRIYSITNTSSTRIVGGSIRRRDRMSPVLFGLYALPTSINTAWLSVATCLGLAVLAASQGMSDVRQNYLAVTLATVVSVFAVWIVLRFRDVAYGLTVIWALSAVLQAQKHVELVRQLCIVAIVLLGLSCGFIVVRRIREYRQAQNRTGAGSAVQESLLGTSVGATV